MADIDSRIALDQGGAAPINFADTIRLGQQIAQQRQIQQQEMMKQQALAERQQQLQGLAGQGGTSQEMAGRFRQAGFLPESMELEKHASGQETARLNQQGQIGTIIKNASAQLLANPTEATGLALATQLERMTGQNMDDFKAQLMSARGDPNAIKRIAAGYALEAERLLPKTENLETGAEIQTRQIDPITGQITPISSTPMQLSPGQVQQGQIAREGNQVQMRGQDMADRRAAMNVEASARKDMAKDTSPAEKRLPIQQAISTLDRLVAHPGSSKALGSASLFPTIPGSEAADFESQLDTFKSQAFLQSISQMKGMGALSNAEGEKLASAVGALSLKQGKKAFDASVDRIKKEMIEKYEAHTGQKFEQKKEENGIPHVERLLDKYRD